MLYYYILDDIIFFFQKGNEIAEVQLQQVSQQMDVFKQSLEEFAIKYKTEIRKNSEFR